MNDSFNTLPWHDAELREMVIDRRHAGECDEVRLHVAWPQGDAATVLFRDCYGMTAEMNFGIIAEERIASAVLIENDLGLISIRERWQLLGVSLDQLRCYRIETASTFSILKIYANQFEVK